MLFIKGIYLLLSHLPTSPTFGGCLTPSSAITHLIAPTAQYTAIGKKPPKSGCRNVIPRFALSRRRATALFRNPVRKAQRSVPGFSSTPTSACRRYATSPPSAVAIRHRPPSSSDCASTSSAIHLHALRRCALAPTAQAVTPSVNPRPRRGYTHRRICAAERRR